MKPFNLKKALAGHPLVTRDGEPVKSWSKKPNKRGYYEARHHDTATWWHLATGECNGLPDWDIFLASNTTPTKPRPKSETRKNVERIRAIMGRKWIKLDVIESCLERRYGVFLPEQSVSARVRDLRKDEYGGYDVRKKQVGKGLFAYKNFGKKGAKA